MSPLFLFPIFIHAFYPSFFALIFGPLFPSASSFHLVSPPPTSTSSIRLTVVLIADLSENRALIFSSPKLCPAKLTPLALTFLLSFPS